MAESTEPRERWTFEQKEQLHALVKEGKNDVEIAVIMDRSFYAVRNFRQRTGLLLRGQTEHGDWTDELVVLLKKKWVDEQKSAGVIAKELFVECSHPFSRNAIIGKIHRLKIGRPEPIESQRLGHRTTGLSYKTKRIRRLEDRAKRSSKSGQFIRLIWSAPPVGPQVGFLELRDNHCRYIAGEPNGLETQYCSSPIKYRSFCAYHASKCYGRDERKPQRSLLGAAPVTTPSPDDPAGAALPLPGAA